MGKWCCLWGNCLWLVLGLGVFFGWLRWDRLWWGRWWCRGSGIVGCGKWKRLVRRKTRILEGFWRGRARAGFRWGISRLGPPGIGSFCAGNNTWRLWGVQGSGFGSWCEWNLGFGRSKDLSALGGWKCRPSARLSRSRIGMRRRSRKKLKTMVAWAEEWWFLRFLFDVPIQWGMGEGRCWVAPMGFWLEGVGVGIGLRWSVGLCRGWGVSLHVLTNDISYLLKFK